MDKLREAFSNIKKDINFLKEEIYLIRKKLDSLENLSPTQKDENLAKNPYPSDKYLIKNKQIPHFKVLKALKTPNFLSSTGNEGVSTDRQTDRQTDQHSEECTASLFLPKNPSKSTFLKQPSFDVAKEVVKNIDLMKQDLKNLLSSLTHQEMKVLCTVYSIGDKEEGLTYLDIAKAMGLTESSIRDYIIRLIKKGAPLEKEKIQNKQIRIKINDEFKRVVSLPTLLNFKEKQNIR